MKKYIIIIVLLFFLVGFWSCSPSFEKKEHTVEKVINGNTIQLKSGLLVHLIGVEEDERAKEYLQKEVVSQKIKLRFDRSSKQKVNNKTKEIYAYAYLHRRCINSFLLSSNLSSLNTLHLTDSLVAFQSYSNNGNLASTTNSDFDGIESMTTLSLQELVKKVKPAVFFVTTFSGNEGISQGTGFFISSDGKALSNFHVFEGGDNHKIQTIDRESHNVTQILEIGNSIRDFVLFQNDIDGTVPYLKLTTELPEEGEEIIVLGNPIGLESTVTRGIVSALREKGGVIYIQIDAAISHGSSGSPVLNKKGEVVGIATLKITDCENCNFAVSIQSIANQIGL